MRCRADVMSPDELLAQPAPHARWPPLRRAPAMPAPCTCVTRSWCMPHSRIRATVRVFWPSRRYCP